LKTGRNKAAPQAGRTINHSGEKREMGHTLSLVHPDLSLTDGESHINRRQYINSWRKQSKTHHHLGLDSAVCLQEHGGGESQNSGNLRYQLSKDAKTGGIRPPWVAFVNGGTDSSEKAEKKGQKKVVTSRQKNIKGL